MTASTRTAASWYFDQGAPRYVADAFGDFYSENTPGWEFPAAVRSFNHDSRALPWLHWHGHCKGRHLTEMCADCRTYAQFGEML